MPELRQDDQPVPLVALPPPAELALHNFPVGLRLLPDDVPADRGYHQVGELQARDIELLVLQTEVDDPLVDGVLPEVVGAALSDLLPLGVQRFVDVHAATLREDHSPMLDVPDLVAEAL